MKRFGLLIIALLSFTLGASSQDIQKKHTLNPCLIIIDVQNAFMQMMSKEDQDNAIQMMNYALMIFRQQNLPIIRVYHKSAEYGVMPGTEAFEYPESIQISQGDQQVIKTYPSSFVKTGLDSLLHAREINTLFLCGLSAAGCVLATYMDAFSHDYKAFMIKDAMLSQNEEYTNQIENIFNALDLETVMFMLEIGIDP
ncbi:MAG: cysteine hydrolase [Bacteroidales bacterium]|nr:cysteine hydrolase [Lentimicrobiaceae bacterium]MDD5695677.1 cysteine hydrolase [Bacteroidales bacterium]